MASATGERAGVTTDTDWQNLVKGTLKAEMRRRNLTYEVLATKLRDLSVHSDPHVLRNKVSRAGFSAAFLLQCLKAMGCLSLDLR
jgi:hypothetical protein